MRILESNDFPLGNKTAVAVGLFDGVHIGHQKLIDGIRQAGEDLLSAIYTFDIKPAVSEMIFTHDEKVAVFRQMGICYYHSQMFDRQFAKMTPAQFVEMLRYDFNMRQMTVGYDFRFGRDASGDTALLKKYAKEYRFELNVIPGVEYGGQIVSSSRIRDLLKKGDMEQAAVLLGKYYFVEGNIEHGKQLGNKIGFPTANLSTGKLLPCYGVYATVVKSGDKLYRAVTNVGTKPTVKDDNTPNVETFIMDFAEDLYGKEIRVCFVKLLRGEKKFGSIDELKAQIGRDSEAAATELKDLDVYKDYIMC